MRFPDCVIALEYIDGARSLSDDDGFQSDGARFQPEQAIH